MKKKLYLGNGIYISMLCNKKNKKNPYLVKLEFYDIFGDIARIQLDYCATYIDAYYHFNDLRDQYFSLF